MTLTTKFTKAFGSSNPFVQGGMQWVGRAELVSAVANSGALGFVTALTQPTPADLAKEIDRCRELTDKPFGVNLTILPTINPPPYDEDRQVIVDEGIKIVETAGSNPAPHLPMFHDNGIMRAVAESIADDTELRGCLLAEGTEKLKGIDPAVGDDYAGEAMLAQTHSYVNDFAAAGGATEQCEGRRAPGFRVHGCEVIRPVR